VPCSKAWFRATEQSKQQLPMKRLHAFAEGRVQGVFYRANTEKVAKALSLQGWVRNLKDGRVEVVAEGPKEKLDLLVEWMRKGPPHAAVTGVAVGWSEATGEFAKDLFCVTK
jgi:acylphosphatase